MTNGFSRQKSTSDSELETSDNAKPHERIQLQDGAVICNFEVSFQDEPEPEEVYAGGLKGIRALRKQRDNEEYKS